MLLFEITDSKKIELFNVIFSNMKNFTDTMSIMINNDKMIIQGMDSSHVLLHDLDFSKEWFDKYEVTDVLEFGLNTEIISNILQFHSKGQHIRLLCDDNDSDVIFFEFLNIDENCDEMNKYLNTPKIVMEFDAMVIPNIDYDCKIKINIKKVKSLFNDLSKMGSKITYKCTSNKCSISTTSVKIDVEEKNVIEYVYETLREEDLKLTFSLAFMLNMCKLEKLCNNVNINLSETAPLLFKYNVDELLKIQFYLAPYDE